MQADDFSNPFSSRPVPRPLVTVFLAFCGGILFAHYFPFRLSYGCLAILVFLLAWVSSIRKPTFSPRREIHWRMALILVAILGAIRMQATLEMWKQKSKQAESFGRMGTVSIAGTVEEIGEYNNKSGNILLSGITIKKWNRIEWFPGSILLHGDPNRFSVFEPGDRLQTTGRIQPVLGSSVPIGFDWQLYRHSQNIFGSVNVEPESILHRYEPVRWNTVRGLAYSAVHRIKDSIPPKEKNRIETLGLYASICFGLRSFLPTELSNALTYSGLAHITSISGLHVTLILAMTAWILKRLGLRRRHAAWIIGFFAIFYLFMVGLSIPTLRAVLMTFSLLGSYIVERRIDSLNSLALAALVILLLHPGELFLPSFQLSFTAVLMLILWNPLSTTIQNYLPFWIPKRIFFGTIASIAVVIGLSPFTISYFHIFSWGAILANLIAIPLVSFILPLTYFWSFCSLLHIPELTYLVGEIDLFFTHLLLSVIDYFARPIFFIEIPSISLPRGAIQFAIVLLLTRPTLILFDLRGIPIRACMVVLIFVAVFVWLPIPMELWKPLQVDFLALGQGDCSVIRTPDNRTIIIDGGPSPRNPDPHRPSMLVQYLTAEGIRHIDAMILTHPQADHIGALSDVARRISIGLLLEGCRQSELSEYISFQSMLEQKKVERILVRRGDLIAMGEDCRLWIINPADESLPQGLDINEKSVAVILQYRDWDFLFTGDIGQETEKQLCESLDNWDMDILKVPHHGSRYSCSEAFLQEIKPEIAIIQVGKNPYGHPSDETRFRLIDAGAQVLRNDEDGTIRLRVWRDRLRIYTTRSNKLFLYDLPDN